MNNFMFVRFGRSLHTHTDLTWVCFHLFSMCHLFFVSSMLISNRLTSPPLPPPFNILKICSYSSLLLYELTSLPFFNLASFLSASTFYSIAKVNLFFNGSWYTRSMLLINRNDFVFELWFECEKDCTLYSASWRPMTRSNVKIFTFATLDYKLLQEEVWWSMQNANTYSFFFPNLLVVFVVKDFNSIFTLWMVTNMVPIFFRTTPIW